MPGLTQENRQLILETPLGKDALLLTDLSGHEEVSRLFSYDLQMVSTKESISPDEIVGKNVTVGIEVSEDETRYFNGYVSRFSAGDFESGYREYEAEIVPWLWFLTQTSDCRIFQNKKIPEIIEQIFKDLGFDKYKMEITGNHKKWEYCVQYRETDFNFVSRLMEQEGIFYYFEHKDGEHNMVLSDHKGAYKDLPESNVEFIGTTGGNISQTQIDSWEHEYEYCSGKWAQTDYDFKKPKTKLLTQTKSVVKVPGIDKYEIYDYPGEYVEKSDGDAEVKIRMEEEETPHDQVSGSSNCRTFNAGGTFTIEKHPSESENDKKYLITSITHTAHEPSYYLGDGQSGGSEEVYSNSFTAIPSTVIFRPARTTPKPLVSGIQTAVVTGPDGEEIYCDKYGRVKVQFHWDREGKNDDKSSCWIRSAHNVAGKKWGFFSLPRIGQEVVVDFLEGDPDRPLIVGSVYNDIQMPHYDLPADQTKSYIKTNSSKGGDGFNELRFEDKKDKEQIFVHAERDMDVRVKNDSMERIYGNRHQIMGFESGGDKGGDQRELVYQDKHLNVKRDQIEHIEGNYQLMVGNGGAEDGGKVDVVVEKQTAIAVGSDGVSINIEGDKKEKIDGSESHTVFGARKEKVGGQSLTVDMDQHTKVGFNSALEAGQEVHIKAGMKVIIEAGLQLTLKVGGNFVDIGPAGVTITGTMVNINSGGAAGSGSGCSPENPEEPSPSDVEKAEPKKPKMADNSKTGHKSSS